MDDTQFMQSFDQYVESLIERKGLSKAPEDKKEILRTEIKNKIDEEFNKKVLAELPDEKLDEFIAIIEDENRSTDEAGEIIKSANIDTTAIMEQVLGEFQEFFLADDEEEADHE